MGIFKFTESRIYEVGECVESFLYARLLLLECTQLQLTGRFMCAV
jgi:hypothetical protein